MTMKGTSLPHIELPVSTHSKGRKGHKVTAIVVHHNAGNLSLKQAQNIFQSRKSSAHYDIDVNGAIAQYVDEDDRSWCTSGEDPDLRTITIELANDKTGGVWHISDKTMQACVYLCTDICKRYGISKLYYDGKRGTLLRHCDYAPTACPGPYFKQQTDNFCRAVNAGLGGAYDNHEDAIYHVQAGAFKSKENAEAYQAELKKQGIDTVIKGDKV